MVMELKNLSYNNVPAHVACLFFQQTFELTDGVYQACRVSFGSKAYLWENF